MSRRGSVASQWTEYKFTCVSVCPSHFLSTRQHARRRLRTSLLRWRRHLGLSVHVAWLWPTPSVPRHLRSRRAALQATTFVYVRPFDRGRIYTFKSNPLRCILDLLIRWDCRRTSAWWTSLVRRRHLETEHLPSPPSSCHPWSVTVAVNLRKAAENLFVCLRVAALATYELAPWKCTD